MRRRRQGKWDEVEGLGPSPEKKHFPKVISLGIFYRSFYRQKTWTRRTVTRSLGTRILRFNCETELKLSKNSRSDQRRRSHLNTPLS